MPDRQLALEGVLRPHLNQQLFSDHFLNERLPRVEEWQALLPDAEPVRRKLKLLYQSREAVLPELGEMQLEEAFVRPILRALGHTFSVQAPLATSQGTKRPDYILYGSQEATDAHAGQTLDDTLLRQGGLAVVDAKAWGRSLDAPAPRAAGSDAFGASNPSAQISFYMQQSGLQWGVLTDGRYWRLYNRDTAHKLDRFYEVDLPAVLESERPEDFLYFYGIFRRGAFEQSPVGLATILSQSVEYAQAVGESIKAQVFAAVRLLAQGFLDYTDNELDADPTTLRSIYDNSLVVLYRLLFVLYAEARGLLPVHGNSRYREDYSLFSMKRDVARRLEEWRARSTRTAVLWGQLRELFRLIDRGDPPLQVATFNGGLFDPDKHPFLDEYSVGDAHLERALDLIARVQGEFVDYRDLATRHLGTIYEGLLEYHLVQLPTPETDESGTRFTVALLNDKGERKSSGSFYTPDYIVEHIVEASLTPLIAKVRRDHVDEAERAEAILRLNVLDPAMGSAHFLVEATDFLAGELARLNVPAASMGAAEGALDFGYWKRRVAQSCIYGVDLNPLAVELAKLSLWISTASKNRPLSFLDHHLRQGNSLVGARLSAIKQARTSSGPRRRTTKADESQTTLLDLAAFRVTMRGAVAVMARIEARPALTVQDVKAQEEAYLALHEELIRKYGRTLNVIAAIQYGLTVDESLRKVLFALAAGGDDGVMLPEVKRLLTKAQARAEELRFVHWEVEFPDVFFSPAGESLGTEAGFDAVVGNPPYDVLAARERGEPVAVVQEFLSYARRDPILAPVLGRKVDLFRLFLAQALELGRPGATAGFIVPLSLLGDQQATTLRKLIFSRHAFASIDAFPQKDDPRRRVFPEAKLPTCVVVLRCRVPGEDAFRVTAHPGRWFGEVVGEYETTRRKVAKADPDTLAIPLLTSGAASGLAAKLQNAPGACRMGDLFTSSQGEINETTMDHLAYRERRVGPKILRGSNIRRYWFDPDARQGVDKFLDLREYRRTVGGDRVADTTRPRLGYQRNAALDSSRRLLFTELPVPCYCFDSISYIPIEDGTLPYAWLALLNSDLLEWVFRQTSTNNHVSTDQVHRLPALRNTPALGKTPQREMERLVADALEISGNAARAHTAAAFVERLSHNLHRNPPRVDGALEVLDALGRAMIALERDRREAIDTFYIDLEGLLGDQAERLGRLWTPPRISSRTSAGARARQERELEEAGPVLGPLAKRVLDFGAVGLLDEEQWKWLVRRRIQRLQGLGDVVQAYRRRQPGIAALDQRVSATEWMINHITYSAFRLSLDEIHLVEAALRRPSQVRMAD